MTRAERGKLTPRKDIRSTDSKPLRTNLTAEEREGGTYRDFIGAIDDKKQQESDADSSSGQINPELLK